MSSDPRWVCVSKRQEWGRLKGQIIRRAPEEMGVRIHSDESVLGRTRTMVHPRFEEAVPDDFIFPSRLAPPRTATRSSV